MSADNHLSSEKLQRVDVTLRIFEPHLGEYHISLSDHRHDKSEESECLPKYDLVYSLSRCTCDNVKGIRIQ